MLEAINIFEVRRLWSPFHSDAQENVCNFFQQSWGQYGARTIHYTGLVQSDVWFMGCKELLFSDFEKSVLYVLT